MMRVFNIFLIVLCLDALLFGQASKDTLHNDIILRTYIVQEQVPLNRNVIYHVELQWEGPLTRYRISDIGEPVATNLVSNGNGSSNKISTNAEGRTVSTKIITYYFKPVEMGMAYIDGVTIKYEDLFTNQQESLLSGRIGVKIIEPLPDPGEGMDMVKTLSLVLILAAVGASIYFFLQYRKRKEEVLAKSMLDRKEILEDKYLRLLKETVHYKVESIKESVGDLSRLLSSYFLERYQINMTGLSGDKLGEQLKDKRLNEESVLRIIDFYERTEKVKFAGEGIDESDFHRLYDTVELVLEHQKSKRTEKEEV
jgi:hypothetical protein